MLKEHNRVFVNLLLIVDMLVVSGAWLAAYYLRFHAGIFPVYRGVPDLLPYLLLLCPIILIWAVAFHGFGLYRQKRFSSRLYEVREVAGASVSSILLLVTITFFVRRYEYSRLVFLLFLFISFFGVAGVRWYVRVALRYARTRGQNLRHAVVVGTGPQAEGLITRIEEHPEVGIKLVGVVSTSFGQNGHGGQGGRRPLSIAGVNVIGGLHALKDIIRAHDIDQVFVALTWEEHSLVMDVLENISDETVDIRVVPDLYEFMTLGGGVEEFDGVPIINLQNSTVYGWNVIIKRAADIIISATGLAVASPVMLAIAVLVRVTSGSPVLYRQERMSIGGDRFVMLKFRTMKNNAEEDTGPVWSIENDSRRTRLGMFLRRTSLDELPQLINVLKGEMSLVGPRPERPVFIREFRDRIPGYMLRHKVKAGITGWAQVNGWRGNTDIGKRLEHDIYYIKNWSMTLDLKILWMTLRRGFINRNAY